MPLEIVRDPRELRLRVEDARRDGRRIALVPTMGYLHDGHVALLAEGRRRADLLVLSIFVNPTQFGPNEDLARYPRDLDGDLAHARAAGVDLVFVPEVAAMYPDGYQTYISVRGLEQGLCGASRPGHFAGVASVVAKLFHLAQPHVAVFGEKDYQQLAVLRRMVRDLDFHIELVGVPIVRELDGLARSSRNAYLSTSERVDALSLVRALGRAEALVRGGECDTGRLAAAAREVLAGAASARVDYVELRDAETLETVARIERPTVLALAVFVGKTRLIDNRVLTTTSI
ncbi:MAG: pantoate--beta-alanine ligase [Myxococcales bacterium]|nr:pantoate--beta-alanine ligase [Myxococcales bacterium]